MEISTMPKLTVTIVKVDNGWVVEMVDPTPILKAAKRVVDDSGPTIKSDEDIDRSIEAMIAFNKHMQSEIIEGEDWRGNDSKKQLLREGFKLHFPQFFQRQTPNIQLGLVVPQSLVFSKMDDLLKFVKSRM